MGYFNKRKFKDLTKSARKKKKDEKELNLATSKAAARVSEQFEPDPNDTTEPAMNEAVKAALIRSEIQEAEKDKDDEKKAVKELSPANIMAKALANCEATFGYITEEPLSMGEFKKLEEESQKEPVEVSEENKESENSEKEEA